MYPLCIHSYSAKTFWLSPVHKYIVVCTTKTYFPPEPKTHHNGIVQYPKYISSMYNQKHISCQNQKLTHQHNPPDRRLELFFSVNLSFTSRQGGCLFLCRHHFFLFTHACTKIFNFMAHHHFCSSWFLR